MNMTDKSGRLTRRSLYPASGANFFEAGAVKERQDVYTWTTKSHNVHSPKCVSTPTTYDNKIMLQIAR